MGMASCVVHIYAIRTNIYIHIYIFLKWIHVFYSKPLRELLYTNFKHLKISLSTINTRDML